MKVRFSTSVLALTLVAVLALGVSGVGSAAPAVSPTTNATADTAAATFKVALVTDIGGLDDRSFNFLANKGLQDAKRKLGIQGRVFISRSNGDYIPNLRAAVQQYRANLVIAVGFLMADSLSTVAKAFPKTKFAIVDNTGVAAELKGKPTNVRGLLFKEQEAGYLAGYLAALAMKKQPRGQGKLGAVGGMKIPPVDRFIAGYYVGAKKAWPQVRVSHSYSQEFVDQAKCKEQALNLIANGAGVVFQVAGQCGLGVLSAAREKGMWGIGVDADQGYLGPHVLTSATKKVDVAVYNSISAAKTQGSRFKTNFNAVFTVKNNGVGYGKISTRILPAWKKELESIRLQIVSGKIKVTAQTPPGG
ncbi:MAG TPA: BMP family ABC transporter substrate-binding protein [Gaiellaceae bacterium]|nr:BMP family ABC transporter substrate-binding protein [Gaiellaceae bacterium]